MIDATTPKNPTITSKMNLISLNTSLEVGLSASASSSKVKAITKVTTP